MRKTLLVGFLWTATAAAQTVKVDLTLPMIHFSVAPPVVVVAPGVQVVEDYDHEVFFVDGWYWVLHGGAWYRTKDHRGGWVPVVVKEVPVLIVKLPPGQYRKFKGPKHGPPGEGHGPPGHVKKHKGKR